MELSPLYRSVDTDALDSLVANAEGTNVAVSFEIEGLHVAVRGDRTIQIEPPELDEVYSANRGSGSARTPRAVGPIRCPSTARRASQSSFAPARFQVLDGVCRGEVLRADVTGKYGHDIPVAPDRETPTGRNQTLARVGVDERSVRRDAEVPANGTGRFGGERE